MKKIYVLFLILLVSLTSKAQWEQANGPYGGRVTSLAKQGENIYAGTFGGWVYLSKNSGESWNLLNLSGITSNYYAEISSIAVNDNKVYVGTNNGNIYFTADTGSTWTDISIGVNNSVTSFLFKGDSIFTGLDYFNMSEYGGGIYLSTNGGMSWSHVLSGLPYMGIRCLANLGTTFYAGTSYNGLLKSVDDGLSWTEVNFGNNDLGNNFIMSILLKDSLIFVGTNGLLYRSDDYGGSWSHTTFGLPYSIWVHQIICNNDVLYSASSSGIYLSNNYGVNWTAINNGMPVHNYATSLVIIDSVLITGTNYKGVYKTNLGNYQWHEANTGLAATRIMSLAISDTNIIAGSALGDIFYTHNDAMDWLSCGNLDSNYQPITSLLPVGEKVFAVTYGEGIVVSNDNGSTWVPHSLNQLLSIVYKLALFGNNIIAGEQSSYLLSSDTGATWIEQNLNLNNSISSILASDSNLFLSTWGGGILLSEDYGLTWNQMNSGLPNLDISSIKKIGNFIFATPYAEGVYISTDNGLNWNATNNGLTDLNIVSLEVNGSDLYALGYYDLFFSSDSGTTWSLISSGLPKTIFNCMAFKGNDVYIGTENYGVWKKSSYKNNTPLENKKFAIYPNPATDKIIIGGNANTGSVAIYNTSGIQILSQPFISKEINISNLSPGLYFVKISDKDGVTVRKFIKE